MNTRISTAVKYAPKSDQSDLEKQNKTVGDMPGPGQYTIKTTFGESPAATLKGKSPPRKVKNEGIE